jgi:ATP-binding cassette, subfamily B, bacterial
MKPFWTQLKFVLPYLRPHRRVLVASLVLSLFSTTLGMVQPYFAKIIIDRVFLERMAGVLAPLLGLMIALLIISFLIRVGNNYIYTRYSARFLFKLREDLFDHLHRIPLRFFTRRKIGDIYSRVATDMAEVQGVVTDTLPQYLFNCITCLITVIILFWLHWKMALMSLVVLPLGLLMIYKIRPKILTLSKDVTETNADIAHFLFESLSNTSLIRAYGAERSENTKLHEKQNKVLRFLLRYQILGAFSGAVPIVFIIINTLIVFGYGGMLVLEGTLTVGSLVAFSIYQGRLLGPLQGMMDGYFAIQKTKIALTRVREILDIPKTLITSGSRTIEPGNFKGDIAFEEVTFAYDTGTPVFENLSFNIPAGSVTALVGPSGVGKTTICHLIQRLFDPDSGRITLDGIDFRDLDIGWFRKHMALVSQDTFLFHTSILENIRFSCPDADQGRVLAAARAACIDEFIQTLPQGYQTEIGDRGLRLSGGQKQRISVARAILLDPKILILDEATAFLDSNVEDHLKETLRNLMRNRVVLVVSHRASTIRGADQIITMETGGRITRALKTGTE